MKRLAHSLAVLSLFVSSACSVNPTFPRGVFPDEFPRVPPPQAAAAEVPAGYEVEVFMADLEYPTSIEFDSAGNAYVAEAGFAYGDPVSPGRILRVARDGSINILADQITGPINDLLWHENRLYIAHMGRISVPDGSGGVRTIVDGLPVSFGHQNNQMTAGPDGRIYFGLGTITNSGVVGLDDSYPFMWNLLWPDRHDVPARDIRLTRQTFLTPHPSNVLARQGRLVSFWTDLRYALYSIFSRSRDKSMLVRTGAFQPFGSFGDGTVEGAVKSNGTILRMNADGSGLEVYAWGLRNPYGVSWSPAGTLYASDNGYDERGSRPIANAQDNVWLIREGAWYGWPDYSSGIPVTDRRFHSERGPRPKFLMREHPPVEKPLVTIPKHAAVTKMDFSRSAQFGFEGQMFLGQFGSGVPATGDEPVSAGQLVARIDVNTGEVQPFFRTRPAALGPEGREYIETSGPKHPVDVRFSPDGSELYIVDIGAFTIYLGSAGPFPRPFPGTGVIWRVKRAGAASGPTNLSPVPPKAYR